MGFHENMKKKQAHIYTNKYLKVIRKNNNFHTAENQPCNIFLDENTTWLSKGHASVVKIKIWHEEKRNLSKATRTENVLQLLNTSKG